MVINTLGTVEIDTVKHLSPRSRLALLGLWTAVTKTKASDVF